MLFESFENRIIVDNVIDRWFPKFIALEEIYWSREHLLKVDPFIHLENEPLTMGHVVFSSILKTIGFLQVPRVSDKGILTMTNSLLTNLLTKNC